jgi:uncharacterized membrane protein YbhN (UPF0104 family)
VDEPMPDYATDNESQGATDAVIDAEIEQTRRRLTRRQIIAQIIGFFIGLGLLTWCIYTVVQDPTGWHKLLNADPRYLFGMVGCTIVSLFVNGTVFWATLQPYAKARFDHLHWLNLVASLLNYAPVRVGLIVRIIYHMRVDRMRFLQIGAWIAAITFTVFLTIGACVAATLPRPEVDWITVVLTIVYLLVFGYVLSIITRHAIVSRYGQGLDRVLSNRRILIVTIGLRLLEIVAIAVRMWCGLQILGIELSLRDILLLAYTDLLFSVIPIGRVGYREAAIAVVATWLTTKGITGDALNANMATLGLIVSAGELMIVLPTGLIALVWLKRRWAAARATLRPVDA